MKNITDRFINKDLHEYLEKNKDLDEQHEMYIEDEPDSGRTGPRIVVTICTGGNIVSEEEFFYSKKSQRDQDIDTAHYYYSFA